MPKLKDLTGQKFNRLTVLRRGPNHSHGDVRWYCICECNTEKLIRSADLIDGHTKSCGCRQKEVWTNRHAITHGMSSKNRKFHKRYDGMIRRCYSTKSKYYSTYGGRGIKVCDRWRGPEGPKNFYDDMFSTWRKGLSLDRIDNNGNYSPENCRWATPKEQMSNRRNTLRLTYQNVILTAKEWAEIVKISYSVILQRLKRKWTVEESLFTPIKHNQIVIKLFNEINKEMGWTGRYFENGGEFRVLNYRVDFYEPNLNIVIEYDERRHKFFKSIAPDKLRQDRIIEKLGCKFFRIKEGEEDKWREIVKL